MSSVLTASQICGKALRAIGAFPITESAPDGEQLREAMSWLDLIMAETAGTEKIFTLVPSTLPIPLVNGTGTYNLNNALGANLPINQVQYPIDAWLQDQNGNRYDLTITQRQTFEDVYQPAETGVPIWIYIDRLPNPTLRTFPTIDAADPNTYTLYLLAQTYAPNVAPAGVTGTVPQGSILTGFSQAWQRWLVLQLAHDLASGPVIKLPQPSIDNFDKMAGRALERLLAFENREHDTEDPVCDPAWDMDDGCLSEQWRTPRSWGTYR